MNRMIWCQLETYRNLIKTRVARYRAIEEHAQKDDDTKDGQTGRAREAKMQGSDEKEQQFISDKAAEPRSRADPPLERARTGRSDPPRKKWAHRDGRAPGIQEREPTGDGCDCPQGQPAGPGPRPVLLPESAAERGERGSPPQPPQQPRHRCDRNTKPIE